MFNSSEKTSENDLEWSVMLEKKLDFFAEDTSRSGSRSELLNEPNFNQYLEAGVFPFDQFDHNYADLTMNNEEENISNQDAKPINEKLKAPFSPNKRKTCTKFIGSTKGFQKLEIVKTATLVNTDASVMEKLADNMNYLGSNDPGIQFDLKCQCCGKSQCKDHKEETHITIQASTSNDLYLRRPISRSGALKNLKTDKVKERLHQGIEQKDGKLESAIRSLEVINSEDDNDFNRQSNLMFFIK